MNRRPGLFLVLTLVMLPLAAAAQPARVPRVGLLCSVLCTPAAMQAFRTRLRANGYVDGQNVTIEDRREDRDADRMEALVRELIGKPVDVIVAIDTVPSWLAR